MSLTKHREDTHWRVHFNGQRTPFTIHKGDGPKWGHPQTYDVCEDIEVEGRGGDYDFLFETKAVWSAEAVLKAILETGAKFAKEA